MPKIAIDAKGGKTLEVEAKEFRALDVAASISGVIAGAADGVAGGDKIKPKAEAAKKAIAEFKEALQAAESEGDEPDADADSK